jgi:hypothetical protein
MFPIKMSGTLGVTEQLGATVFAFFIIGLGIPLFSVLTRLNLCGGGMISHSWGNVLAVYLPFGLSWFLYDGKVLTKILAWGGIAFTSVVAFLLPIVISMYVVKRFPEREGSIDVYCGYLRSPRAQLLALWVLLGLAVSSIVLAIVGNFI